MRQPTQSLMVTYLVLSNTKILDFRQELIDTSLLLWCTRVTILVALSSPSRLSSSCLEVAWPKCFLMMDLVELLL